MQMHQERHVPTNSHCTRGGHKRPRSQTLPRRTPCRYRQLPRPVQRIDSNRLEVPAIFRPGFDNARRCGRQRARFNRGSMHCDIRRVRFPSRPGAGDRTVLKQRGKVFETYYFPPNRFQGQLDAYATVCNDTYHPPTRGLLGLQQEPLFPNAELLQIRRAITHIHTGRLLGYRNRILPCPDRMLEPA